MRKILYIATREAPRQRETFFVYADNIVCVALLLSASTRLLFLGGGFFVGLEEGLLDVGGDELVAAVLWLPTEVGAKLG